MANSKLENAKKQKNDEFYTRFIDIQSEVNAYLEYNPDVFRGKTVLLPCDDPEWSNFTKFFAQNFEALGLKKLISTSYALDKHNPDLQEYYQISWFETESEQFDEIKAKSRGKIFVLTRNKAKKGNVNIDDLRWSYLKGDGDFRSDEVKALRDEADIIVTNPPFSLFQEFVNWIFEGKKQFLIIGNKNSVTYKETFSLIKQNKMWSGKTKWGGGMWFETKNPADVDKVIDGVNMKNVPSVWFTNIEHGRRYEPIPLMSMFDNLRYSRHKDIIEKGYPRYVNFDAIEVGYSDAIPADYDGLMGVPISFLNRYCPDQFEIMGISLELADDMKNYANKGEYMAGGKRFYLQEENGKYKYRRMYDRLVIRRKR